jgi:DNA-directed RNA polymerase I subunit RPA2
MLRKLYKFVGGECKQDNADSMQNLELLLPGHLILQIVKEKVQEAMEGIKLGIAKECRGAQYDKISGGAYKEGKFWANAVTRYGTGSGGAGTGVGRKVRLRATGGDGERQGGDGERRVGTASDGWGRRATGGWWVLLSANSTPPPPPPPLPPQVATFLASGNVVSSSGLDLMQVSGYTIVAERLNFLRYISHYRSVHRGQFFMTMKTTTVRKLLPDSWGFLCPVHTPDGGPCGLLNHMAVMCETQCAPLPAAAVAKLDSQLVALGVIPAGAGGSYADGAEALPYNYLTVCVDGRVVGGCSVSECKRIAADLRVMKVNHEIPPTTEVAFFPPMPNGSGPFPGLFLSTGMSRTIRPVKHIESGKVSARGERGAGGRGEREKREERKERREENCVRSDDEYP